MEMLVVVLIIAILASLIVPNLIKKADQAKVAKATADISSLEDALQSYRLDNDAYPTTDESLDALTVQPSGARNWKGPYLTKGIPADPWGNKYVYQSPGPSGQDYLITSYGPDGQAGGNDDITSDD
jgi:general secretion pathway protein G